MTKCLVEEYDEIVGIFNDITSKTRNVMISRGFPIRYGICTYAAVYMAEEINRYEIPVTVVLGTLGDIEHTWIEDEYGNIYDPTVDMIRRLPHSSEYMKRLSFKTEPGDFVWRFSDYSPFDECTVCGENNVYYKESDNIHDIFACIGCDSTRIQYRNEIPPSKWNNIDYVNELIIHYKQFYPYVKFSVHLDEL